MSRETKMVPLSWLEKAQEITETLATPHRLFDVNSVREAAGDEDPTVAMQLIFVECSNTGIRSSLDRCHCAIINSDADAEPVTMQVDLIKGLLDLAPPETALVS